VGCKLPYVLSFYAEHQMACKKITATEVTKALIAAKDLFASPQDFDLEFQQAAVTSVCPPDTPDAYGVLNNDELSACELIPGKCVPSFGPNPINCAQFGVNG
jgi:hypothetical protein